MGYSGMLLGNAPFAAMPLNILIFHIKKLASNAALASGSVVDGNFYLGLLAAVHRRSSKSLRHVESGSRPAEVTFAGAPPQALSRYATTRAEKVATHWYSTVGDRQRHAGHRFRCSAISQFREQRCRGPLDKTFERLRISIFSRLGIQGRHPGPSDAARGA